MTRCTTPASGTDRPRVPRPLTPFIGREAELEELHALLTDPACRLLTLVGPGGIGKTRLAIEAASGACPHFADGLCFVPLEAVRSADRFVPAIADALELILSDADDLTGRLVHYLHDKAMVVVLDNFEQRRGPAEIEVLLQLLEAAPALKLLLTSREVLKLQQEWLYPVTGLPAPPGVDAARWDEYDAAALLIERARRLRRDFCADREASGIVRICRLVDGMPLALELAASWTRTLRCAEVADEIERSLEFLRTEFRDLPTRHRSIDAVIEQTWRRLLPPERDALMRLAVFRAGFRRAMAEAVAGTTLSVLSALVDKSLLRWEPETGRYRTHELLRHYAEERQALEPGSIERTHERHARYFIDFLCERAERLRDGREHDVLDEVETELADILAAWRWTVGRGRVVELELAARALAAFFLSRSRIVEGVETFSLALDTLSESTTSAADDGSEGVRATLLTGRGWLYLHLGRVAPARRDLDAAWALHRAHAFVRVPGPGTDSLTGLALCARLSGDHERAIALARDARAWAVARDDRLGIATAAFTLAIVTLEQGRRERAFAHASEALGAARATEHFLLMSLAYDLLCRIDSARGRLASAKRYCEASYAIREAFRYPRGVALSLQLMAEIAVLERQHERAETLYRQSLATFRRITDTRGVLQSLCGLGNAAHALGRHSAARESFRQALESARRSRLTPELVLVVTEVERFLAQGSDRERGRTGSSDALAQRVREEGEGTLDRVVLTLLAELDSPIESDEDAGASAPHARASAPRSLAVPLTGRELQVLRLIGAGLTNQEIAERIFVVTGTVKKHAYNIYGKLGVRNRTEALVRARALGLLE